MKVRKAWDGTTKIADTSLYGCTSSALCACANPVTLPGAVNTNAVSLPGS